MKLRAVGKRLLPNLPLALLGYAYSAHTGLMNRGLLNGLFHALGASRLWDGPSAIAAAALPGMRLSDRLVVRTLKLWLMLISSFAGFDLVATNVHFWAKVEETRKRGVKLIVIDPRRTRAAQSADWYLLI
jgi:hypothetical protein